MQVLLPEGWPRPKGYSNGVAARGRQVYIAGMIGWDEKGAFAGDDFASQARQALRNIVAVLDAAGAGPEQIVRMTWYVLDRGEHLRAAMLPIAVSVLERHLAAGDRVVIATGAPPELAHAILGFVAHGDVPVVGSREARRYGGLITVDHCHNVNKLRCLERDGFGGPIAIAYSDSSADLPLLQAARHPVVVNPKASSIARFRQLLPAGTRFLNWGCLSRAGDPVEPMPAASA